MRDCKLMDLPALPETWQATFLLGLDNGILPRDMLRETPGVPPERCFQVYVNQARIGLCEALVGIFPAVNRLVGDEFFVHLATRYSEHNPLQSGDLRTYGASLPSFIETFETLTSLPYLADVAKLEWACHESLHTGHGVTAPPDTPLRLAPHVRLLQSPFPVASIWDFALREHVQVERLDLTDAHPAHLIVARPGRDVEVSVLDASAWHWLANIADDSNQNVDAQTLERQAYWLHRGILGRLGEKDPVHDDDNWGQSKIKHPDPP
jgi:hypothetical protein